MNLVQPLELLANLFVSALLTSEAIVSNLRSLIILVAVLLGLWLTRRHWWKKLHDATCGKIHCPDVRNATCCCISVGCCMMDVCCPFICHRFHPPFGLRLIVVRATRLPADWGSMASSEINVFVEVSAGNNPRKTTSVQPYKLSLLGSAKGCVEWNEPVDLIMYPATTHISIKVRAQETLATETLGSQSLSVDSFYESPGTCSTCTCCGWYPCPRLCHDYCHREYRWPLVRGAPFPSIEDQDPGCCERWSCCRRLRMSGSDGSSRRGIGYEQITPTAAEVQIRQDWTVFTRLREELRDNYALAHVAVRKNPEALNYASTRLQRDKHLRRLAHKVPQPTIIELHKGATPAGRLFLYFVLYDLADAATLPAWISSSLTGDLDEELEGEAVPEQQLMPND